MVRTMLLLFAAAASKTTPFATDVDPFVLLPLLESPQKYKILVLASQNRIVIAFLTNRMDEDADNATEPRRVTCKLTAKHCSYLLIKIAKGQDHGLLFFGNGEKVSEANSVSHTAVSKVVERLSAPPLKVSHVRQI